MAQRRTRTGSNGAGKTRTRKSSRRATRLAVDAPQVVVLMGSDSDADVMEGCTKVLKELGISYAVHVASAHRTPARVQRLVSDAEKGGTRVFVCGAGAAAHLAGVVAAHTIRPVIGVPIDSSPLLGLDALLATAMMPGGIPVATMAVGKAGAKNAGLLAAEIVALNDTGAARRLKAYRAGFQAKIEKGDRAVKRRLGGRKG